ncbi:hypothetical protein EDC01DRAFT_285645 [Geopyxis carbonaria]|nr:hypothetical protein EDC01DRAFT_285645 [Geopyxis carbonaria]
MASRKIANNYIPMRKSTTFDILNHLALLMTICLLPMIASTAETSSKVPLDPVYISEFVDTYAKQEGWAYGIWKAPNGKIGMNASIRCASVYNEALRGASEVDKAAMGVATSVLALIPALLAFTAWYTANIQTLYYLDSDAALNTAGLTLCFDVKTLDTLAKDRILSAAIILVKGGESILDSIIQRGNTWRSDIENLYTPGGPLEFLKKECVEFANKKSLESPNDDAAETLKRPNMIHVHVQTFLFFVLQVALMFAITSGVDQIAVASFIWLCPNLYYIAYLSMLVTAYIAAFVVRGLFYSTWYREAEIFFLEPIPEGQQPETLNPLLSVFEDPDRFLSKSPRTKLERHHANFKEFMWCL